MDYFESVNNVVQSSLSNAIFDILQSNSLPSVDAVLDSADPEARPAQARIAIGMIFYGVQDSWEVDDELSYCDLHDDADHLPSCRNDYETGVVRRQLQLVYSGGLSRTGALIVGTP